MTNSCSSNGPEVDERLGAKFPPCAVILLVEFRAALRARRRGRRLKERHLRLELLAVEVRGIDAEIAEREVLRAMQP